MSKRWRADPMLVQKNDQPIAIILDRTSTYGMLDRTKM